MKRPQHTWAAIVFVCALTLAAGFGTSVAAQAQAPAKIHGSVSDTKGSPFINLNITLTNTATKQTFEAATDNAGRYSRTGMPPGNYTISFKQGASEIYSVPVVLTPGQDLLEDINFKEIQAKENTDQAENEKKAAEARAKFAAMKVHFDAGSTALDAAKQQRTQMDKAPKDQQAALQTQLDTTAGTAITELKAALDSTPDDSTNRHIVLAKLGDAYETDAKYSDAAGYYAKAVAVKEDPSYYNNLGNCLARIGKVDDALSAYQKAIGLDPTNTAMYWRNFAIGLYNSGRIKESVDPLRKATEADPKSAQAWYLLGAALVNTMDFKQEGDKVVPVMQPGTIEAYQKAIDLDPNGPYGAQAKQGMDALQSMGVGIDTKLSQKSPDAKKGKK